MSFRIDVLSSAGVKSGPPITEVLAISISDVINQVGEATITIPASIAAQRGLARGNRYQIYNDDLGYLGEYTHYDATIDASAETIQIVCRDSLIRLAERVAGFRRDFNNLQLKDVLSTLLGDFVTGATTWSATYEGAPITDTITFSVEGENYLRVLDYLRQYVRGWFRRETDTSIKFGKFSSTTPVATFVAPNMVLEGLPTTQALITQITRTRAGSEVINRVYPVGAGIGETKLDLRYSTRTTSSSPYAVTSGTVGGGVTAYWIEDTGSQATYGRVDRVVAWNEIRPITNSAADLQNAANALYDIASAYLTRNKTENDAYTLSAVEVPASLRVGDLIRVVYNGVGEMENGSVGWLNVASNFFVTQITRDFDENGNANCSLNISANGDAVIGNTEILYDILADVQTLKLRTQPTQTYYTKASPTMPIDFAGTSTATFAFNIGSEVLAVNQMMIEFELAPLRTFATGAASGGASAPTSDAGGSSTPTSDAGGSSTPTSNAGGSSTPTTDAGGSSTPTSNVSGVGHGHGILIYSTNPLVNYPVYIDVGYNPPRFYANSGADRIPVSITEQAHTHSVSIPSHTHNVTIPSHTHSVSIPSHTHGVTIPSHTHGVTISAHTHSLTYGVNSDSVNPVITITVDGNAISGITKLSGGGSTNGTSATGPGVFTADILSAITSSNFRGMHSIVFTCTSNRGTVFAQLLSRVTIQPIAV